MYGHLRQTAGKLCDVRLKCFSIQISTKIQFYNLESLPLLSLSLTYSMYISLSPSYSLSLSFFLSHVHHCKYSLAHLENFPLAWPYYIFWHVLGEFQCIDINKYVYHKKLNDLGTSATQCGSDIQTYANKSCLTCKQIKLL